MEEKNTEISARIAEIIERVGETPNSFAKSLGYSRAQTIYDILNGKSAPSYDFFNRLANAEFSAIINFQYLLNGKGNVLKTKSFQSQQICGNNLISNDKNNNNSTTNQTFITDIIDKFLATIKNKDEKITTQAEEIGMLKQTINQLEREKEELVSAVNGFRSANVG